MKNAIRLKSRVFVPSAGVEDKLKDYIEERVKYERIHVIIQFDKVPSLEQRKILEKRLQIKLLDPLPERAFYASVPRQIKTAKSLVKESNIRWIGRIRNEDRIAPYLVKLGVPEHAHVEKAKAELIVEFFSDVSEQVQKNVLSKHNAEIVNRVVPLNGWSIILSEAKMANLSAEDTVKFIAAIPEPPEDDNDGIRSESGINADAVKAGSIYSLSGAGITVAQWEGRHTSFNHNDHMARITLGDPPLPLDQRGYFHDESVSANTQYDNGENVYIDVDDSGTVTANDHRITPIPPLAGNVAVVLGDADIGTALVAFEQLPGPYDGFTDTTAPSGLYNDGEAIYNDVNGSVTNGDQRLTPADTYAAGSIVAPADTDVGRRITRLRDDPHSHATHVAGTILGDGSQSFAAGGTPDQWQGIAPAANLRSYDGPPMTTGPLALDEYTDAASNGATISSNSFGTSHCHQIGEANNCYENGSQYIDAVVSGRRSDGTPSGIANRMLVVSSAGNKGRYGERYVDDSPTNGQYDTGETAYQDDDDNSVVSVGDDLIIGGAKPPGTALTNFTSFEMHGESINSSGTFNTGEGIYLDVDASRSITVGDTRITAPLASIYADGSVVAAGDADENDVLKWFLPNGTVRIPNSAKNTIEVASITSDSQILSEFSSRGPTYDGRFKPDIAAPGCEQGGEGSVRSPTPGNTYGLKCGTSMSTPAVSGSASLLEEWYRSTCVAAGSTPDILKALLIHSAEDLDTIPNFGGGYAGPDFAFGYGRMRTKAAVDLLPNYVKDSAAAVGSTDYNVTIGIMETLKVTLVWDDPAWVSGTAPSLATGRLQNDLDLLLIAPDGTQYTPWITDSTNLFAPAVRSVIAVGLPVPATAEDHRNNIEQVEVPNAMAGTWTIRVIASNLLLPAQDYVLVSEALPPNTADCTVNPAVDVWVKDNPGDSGAVPSTGAMYLSPDIWNRNADDGLTNDSQQNPEFGQANYLYARVRNSSATETVKATSTDAWIGTLSLGLSWPQAFTHVGCFHIPNLAPGETRIVGPIKWYPPAAGHYCMYTRVQSPQDPITYVEGTSVWSNANNSNNIAYLNMTIVDLASSKSISFLVRNVSKVDEDVDIEINIPDELLKVGEVKMMMSPELDSTWPKELRQVPGLKAIKGEYQTVQAFQLSKEVRERYKLPDLQQDKRYKKYRQREPLDLKLPIYKVGAKKTQIRGVRMKAAQADRMTLTFGSKQTKKATYHVHVTQKVKGETVGGILFVVRTGYINTNK